MTSDNDTAIRFDLGDDGIAVLTIDMPGRAMNVLNDDFDKPFVAAVERIESEDAIKAVIITSGKESFMAGADIDRIFKVTDPAVAFKFSEDYKAVLRRLELCGKPVVAALTGTTLGGGLELALACHHRVAIDTPRARFGLPEVSLGLLPGGGGTQRLPRMMGIQASLPLMLEGKHLNAAKAHQASILDELASDRDNMIAMARAWIAANPQPTQPWDEKKFRWPGGDSKTPANGQMWAIAPAMANKKARGNYPAVSNILSCVFEGGLLDFDSACKVESRYFANCVVSQQAKNLMNTLWFQHNAIKKGQSRPDGISPSKVQKLGVLGAGMMGAGIAYSAAKAGIDVVLLDTTMELAERGKSYSEGILDKAIKRGKKSDADKHKLLGRITPTTSFDDLAGCDLVIEAVFEDRDVKADSTKKAEAVIPDTATFASNTSTLPITGLATASARPAQFIGLHFFSPVDKMPLVEIIVGEKTSDATLAKGFDFVRQIGKTPIVVNDSRGFYTSRCFATYTMEGVQLVAEGQNPQAVEAAGLQAGMPVGPLAVLDEVSLSLSLHVIEQTRKDLAAEGHTAAEHPAAKVVEKMVHELDRPGKKAGKGFYDYPQDAKKHLWAGLAEQFPLKEQMSQQELMDRLMFAQANEAARCYGENVVRSVADANIGSIFGWGFAPFEGGTLQYINAYGVAAFVKRAAALASQYGERFKPAPVLVEMAKAGKQFD